MDRQADDVNWQQTTRAFVPGDCVSLLHGDASDVARVVAVWPAIGMLDLQFPSGWTRKRVEDVIKTEGGANPYVPPMPENAQVPGGTGTVPVSAGPPARAEYLKKSSVRRVAEAFVKKSIYWTNKDRQYCPTKSETEDGSFTCPKCKGKMGKARYKRRESVTERLFACQDCLFLIKPMDAGMC